jgi:hypothetical protein
MLTADLPSVVCGALLRRYRALASSSGPPKADFTIWLEVTGDWVDVSKAAVR